MCSDRDTGRYRAQRQRKGSAGLLFLYKRIPHTQLIEQSTSRVKCYSRQWEFVLHMGSRFRKKRGNVSKKCLVTEETFTVLWFHKALKNAIYYFNSLSFDIYTVKAISHELLFAVEMYFLPTSFDK